MSVQTPAPRNRPGLLKRLFSRPPNPTFDQYAHLLKQLELERARSAKLIEDLQGLHHSLIVFGDRAAANAITNIMIRYEASK